MLLTLKTAALKVCRIKRNTSTVVYKIEFFWYCYYLLIHRGHVPFGQHQESELEVPDPQTSHHSSHVQN